MYMGGGGVKKSVFLLRFLLTIYGDFVFRPGRPPCRLVCKPSCKFTLSGYGISYRRRRRGDRGVLGLGGAVANPYRRLVFEIQNEWSIFELNGCCPQILEIYKFSCEYTYNIYRFNCNFFCNFSVIFLKIL